MNIDDLHKIKTVDVSPFLYTRIQQRIKDSATELVPKKLVWTVSLSMLVILFVNAGAIVWVAKKNQKTNTVVESMGLMPDNELYK